MTARFLPGLVGVLTGLLVTVVWLTGLVTGSVALRVGSTRAEMQWTIPGASSWIATWGTFTQPWVVEQIGERNFKVHHLTPTTLDRLRRDRVPFRVWSGDHPHNTREIKARVVGTDRIEYLIGEARWGTDIAALLDQLRAVSMTKGKVMLLPGAYTPGFQRFAIALWQPPPGARRLYLQSLDLSQSWPQ